MRHLVKIAALVYALFSLTSCSRTPGSSDNFTDNYNDGPLVFEGGFGVYVKGIQRYPYGPGRPSYAYTLDGLYKDFRVRTISGEKIHKIDYVVEFDYGYIGSHTEHHTLKVVSDYISPYSSTVMYSGIIMEANETIVEGSGLPVSGFINGVVTIQAYTNLGNTYRLTVYNVPIQLN
jgi:lipoprotein